MKKPSVVVSDHAVLRYLERVGGFNVEGLRRDIQRRMVKTVTGIGAQSVVVEGHRFVVKQTDDALVVVTVLDKNDGSPLFEVPR
jgi:hypothetical protein